MFQSQKVMLGLCKYQKWKERVKLSNHHCNFWIITLKIEAMVNFESID